MHERFTDRALRVMQLANQEAQRFHHDHVGPEHILLGLVKEGAGIAAKVLKNLDINLRRIRLEVEKLVESGTASASADQPLPQAPLVKKVIERAIEEARIFDHDHIGTEHLLLGLVHEREGVVAQVLINLGLRLEDVREEVLHVLGQSAENDEGESGGPASRGQTQALDRFGRDLTALATRGKLGPVIARPAVLQAAMLVLCCRERNNLLIVGEPEVGKSRLLEDLAMVLTQDAPERLRRRRLIAVDVARLGAFPWQALHNILADARRLRDVLLVLDDLALFTDLHSSHMGSRVGSWVLAAISRTGLQWIGATTPAHYQEIQRAGGMLPQGFLAIFLSPLSPEETLETLQGVRESYEKYHGVVIQKEALHAAVQLSAAWADQFFPGKAIRLLDQACALARLKPRARPPALEDLDALIGQLEKEKDKAIAARDFDTAAARRDQADKLRKKREQILHDWIEKFPENVDASVVAATFRRMGTPPFQPA
jgi:ATP-dependent Clp protease ATP-binding subunit ClpC